MSKTCYLIERNLSVVTTKAKFWPSFSKEKQKSEDNPNKWIDLKQIALGCFVVQTMLGFSPF